MFTVLSFVLILLIGNSYCSLLTSGGMPDECFRKKPGFILEGLATHVTTTTMDDGCMETCLNAPMKLNFTCLSIQYYPDVKEDNCIVNMESDRTRLANFAANSGPQAPNVIYYENLCAPFRFPNASHENTAVANITTWTEASYFVGYATFTQEVGADHAVTSLFVSEGLPKTSYSVRIVDGKHCSGSPSFDSDIWNASYLEIGVLTNDMIGYLISKPTPLDISIVGSPKDEKYVLKKAILFVDTGSHEALACGQILPEGPFTNIGYVTKCSVYTLTMLFFVLFISNL